MLNGFRMGIIGAALLVAAPPVMGGDVQLQGHAFARVTSADAPRSWRDGGLGGLDLGSDSDGDEQVYGLGRAHLALEWRPSTTLSAYLHGVARAEPEELDGDALGVIEAFVEFEPVLKSANRLQLRLGHFLLPTSRENIDVAWSSPYTLSFSALNTWIGEEVRLTGLSGAYQWAIGDLDDFRWTVAAFGGNDTAGTLLAWRGWTLGDRLVGFGETAPLPPLPGLAPGGSFELQRDEGTTPFGSDLDGRVGFASSFRYQRSDVGSVRFTFYDNQGDRELHRGEYAWKTSFYLAGADRQFELGQGTIDLAAEWMWGESGMGDLNAAHVDLDFEAGYALASWATEAWRVSVRRDDFKTVDRDQASAYDPNDGEGDAWTFALFYQPIDSPWRWGFEVLDLDTRRTSATLLDPPLTEGSSPEVGGRTLSLELRYLF